MGEKFGKVKMSIVFDYDLDDYADGGEWEREALINMVMRVFLDDVYEIASNGDTGWVTVVENGGNGYV